MEFDRRGQVGEWGQDYVKAYLHKHFGFTSNPYDGKRDIGVDLEIHVTKRNRSTATGGTLKAQIKTTEATISPRIAEGGFRLSVDEQHVDYWVGLHVRVIIMMVSHEEERIWWKEVNSKEDCLGPRGGWSVLFTSEDELVPEFREQLVALADISNASYAKLNISDAEGIFEKASEIYNEILGHSSLSASDIKRIEEVLDDVGPLLGEAKVLLTYENRENDLKRNTIRRFKSLCEQIEVFRLGLVEGKSGLCRSQTARHTRRLANTSIKTTPILFLRLDAIGRAQGVGPRRRRVLVRRRGQDRTEEQDHPALGKARHQAGWHISERLAVPSNITIVPLPPHARS